MGAVLYFRFGYPLLLSASLLLSTLAFATYDCASALWLGARPNLEKKEIEFRVFSKNATHLEVLLFADRHGSPNLHRKMHYNALHNIWSVSISFADIEKAGMKVGKADFPFPFYSYRAWGPNWKNDGSIGSDFDRHGNRFNPNKGLLDPYALEVSHDPRVTPSDTDDVFLTGPHRNESSFSRAPKGVIVPFPRGASTTGPRRPFRDEIIYETHVRGLTRLAPGVPADEQGTFLGIIHAIPYLKALGVTALELMPVFEFPDDANQEKSTEGNNYWGYDPLSFFAPNRRYATPEGASRAGGVIEEFTLMAEALHKADLKLYLDVVYNHTAEGGNRSDRNTAKLLSWRGLDNQSYYQVKDKGSAFQDNTGCGANTNCKNRIWRQMAFDSLRYWIHLGANGYRVDLASILENAHESGDRFDFDKMDGDNFSNRALRELPGRPENGGDGIDLIVEPWGGSGMGTYQLGNFPYHPAEDGNGTGTAEWNGVFRDLVQRAENKWGVDSPTPGEMAAGLSGSQNIFGPGKKGPWASVNFAACHDGAPLFDLNAFNGPNNQQGYPYGPTDGGSSHTLSWDHAEANDTPDLRQRRQRQGARNMLALTLLAYGGVPMIYSGDEILRTQNGNNNAYKIDSIGNWFTWPASATNMAEAIAEMEKIPFFKFTQNLIAFRTRHKSFRPAYYARGKDQNGNGLRDLSWYQADGKSAEEESYMKDSAKGFLGMRIDAEEHGETDVRSIYVVYNWSHHSMKLTLPPTASGKEWYWQGDTESEYEGIGNFMPPGEEKRLQEVIPAMGKRYPLRGRTVAVFVEK